MVYCYSLFLFLIGAVLGSFYGVVGSRLPKGESIIKPRSHCEKCNHELAWYELIPILSYFLQKGKCRECKEKLSIFYPIIELSTGILFLSAYLTFGFGYEFFISIILSSLLIIIFISDIKYMIILDSPLVISAILIFILKWVYFGIGPSLISLLEGLFSFLTMYGVGCLGNVLFKRESLGGGDIKLSFLFGQTLGYQMGIVAFVLSTFLALPYAFACLFMKNNHEVPFGPFLVSALWIVFHFYDKFAILVEVLIGI